VNLDFLTVAGAVAESPMATATSAAGATFEERDGWRVPVSFASEDAEARTLATSVGWADLSHLRKTEQDGPHGLTLGTAVTSDGAWTCPVTARRALVVGGSGADGIDVTSQFGALVIAGRRARDVIARFCALDLRPHLAPPGTFLPGSVARTPSFTLVEDDDRFLILFGAAYALYLWEVVADAGEHLGGRPVGVDALRREVTSHA
jgi:glycine cleavage system aminomethyltransferase T